MLDPDDAERVARLHAEFVRLLQDRRNNTPRWLQEMSAEAATGAPDFAEAPDVSDLAGLVAHASVVPQETMWSRWMRRAGEMNVFSVAFLLDSVMLAIEYLRSRYHAVCRVISAALYASNLVNCKPLSILLIQMRKLLDLVLTMLDNLFGNENSQRR
jgi:hypothetical protein